LKKKEERKMAVSLNGKEKRGREPFAGKGASRPSRETVERIRVAAQENGEEILRFRAQGDPSLDLKKG